MARGRESGRRRAAVFLLVTAAVIAPWTVRNARITGAFVPVATRGSFNLWLGNTLRPWEEVYREHQAVEGGPIAQERHARRAAWKVVLDRQPRWLLDKFVHETKAFWGVNDQIVVHLQRRAYKRQPVEANRLVASLTVILPTSRCSSSRCPPSHRPEATARVSCSSASFFSLVLHVVAFASTRFRLPVLPVLFLLAGQTLDRGLVPVLAGVDREWSWPRGRRRCPRPVGGGVDRRDPEGPGVQRRSLVPGKCYLVPRGSLSCNVLK